MGTSPLYVFASIFTAPPSETDLVGATSLVIWSITALVLVKYAIIVLRADDHGQGKHWDIAIGCESTLVRVRKISTYPQTAFAC